VDKKSLLLPVHLWNSHGDMNDIDDFLIEALERLETKTNANGDVYSKRCGNKPSPKDHVKISAFNNNKEKTTL
jgi:hypothetical protein